MTIYDRIQKGIFDMKKLSSRRDTEKAHIEADEILLNLVFALCEELVIVEPLWDELEQAFEEVPKRYA